MAEGGTAEWRAGFDRGAQILVELGQGRGRAADEVIPGVACCREQRAQARQQWCQRLVAERAAGLRQQGLQAVGVANLVAGRADVRRRGDDVQDLAMQALGRRQLARGDALELQVDA